MFGFAVFGGAVFGLAMVDRTTVGGMSCQGMFAGGSIAVGISDCMASARIPIWSYSSGIPGCLSTSRIRARMPCCGDPAHTSCERIRDRSTRGMFAVEVTFGLATFGGMSGQGMFASGSIAAGITVSGASPRICGCTPCCGVPALMSCELMFAGMATWMMFALVVSVVVAGMTGQWMLTGMAAASVVITGMTSGMMFATVAAGMSASMSPAPASTPAMSASAVGEDGGRQQYRSQRNESPANTENPWFRAAADDFLPVRRCGVWEMLALRWHLDEGFHRTTFLESGRSETRRDRKTSKRDGAQIGRWV